MTLAEFLNNGGNVEMFLNCQMQFQRRTLYKDGLSTARFEGIQEGKAVIRYNGRNENDWHLPYRLDPTEVFIVLNDGKPVPYDARPLTQR